MCIPATTFAWNSRGGELHEPCLIWVIREFPGNLLVTPRYFSCGEVFHPISNKVMPSPRLLRWVIMGNIFLDFTSPTDLSKGEFFVRLRPTMLPTYIQSPERSIHHISPSLITHDLDWCCRPQLTLCFHFLYVLQWRLVFHLNAMIKALIIDNKRC